VERWGTEGFEGFRDLRVVIVRTVGGWGCGWGRSRSRGCVHERVIMLEAWSCELSGCLCTPEIGGLTGSRPGKSALAGSSAADDLSRVIGLQSVLELLELEVFPHY